MRDWLLNLTCNYISVIYVTSHRCASGLKKKLNLGLDSQRHKQARIQEFSSGGVQLSENFDNKQKKKKKKKGGGGGQKTGGCDSWFFPFCRSIHVV